MRQAYWSQYRRLGFKGIALNPLLGGRHFRLWSEGWAPDVMYEKITWVVQEGQPTEAKMDYLFVFRIADHQRLTTAAKKGP